jgi:hypothetical protein
MFSNKVCSQQDKKPDFHRGVFEFPAAAFLFLTSREIIAS